MFGRKRIIVTVVMLVAITLTGCLGGQNSKPKFKPWGNIIGVVVDQDGIPLADVLVSIPNTHVRMPTNAKGEYLLIDIPNGTYSLLATKPGYRMEGFPVETAGTVAGATFKTLDEADPLMWLTQQSATVHVTVTVDGGDVSMPDIRMIAYTGGADDVTVMDMSPGAYASLGVGEKRTLDLDLYYALESSPEAWVVAVLTHGKLTVGSAVERVEQGKGTVRLTMPFTVPNARSLSLQVRLADPYGVLAVTSQSLFRIQGYVEPQPVQLLLDSITPSGIVLTWAENIQDFAELHIYRGRSAESVPGPGNGELIATITDPTTTTFVDDDFMMGDHFAYVAHLHTVDGREFAGTKEQMVAVRTMPDPVVVELGWYPSITGLLYDAGGDRLYATRREGRVTVLSTTTRSVVGDLSLGCDVTSQHTLSADGSQMFFLCDRLQRVGMASLPGGNVTVVDSVGPARFLTYDPLADVLYVAISGEGAEPNTFVVAPDTGDWEAIPLRAAGGLAVVPKLRLLVVKPDTQQGPAVLYDLDTLDPVAQVESWSGSLDANSVRYDGRFLYIYRMMYAPPEFTWYGLTPHIGWAYDISNDGRYWVSDATQSIMLSEWDGYAWSPIARMWGCSITQGAQFSGDAQEFYTASSSTVCFVDVSSVVE